MPELPEVETVRRGLAPVLEGAVIATAEIRRPDLRWPFPDRMQARLAGRRVERLGRRSKYLLADLDSGETLMVHLGMTGRFLVQGAQVGRFYHPVSDDRDAHDHVVLHLDGGARVVYNDVRRFGFMDLCATGAICDHKMIAPLGPEPLSNDFNEDHLRAALGARRSPVKSALLDQKVVAGLGNIYVCEALWRARLAPQRLSNRVKAGEVATLTACIRDVLTDAIEAGGSSLQDFRQADGELGYFQHQFAVYGRETQRCRRENCGGMVARAVQSGRSSFFCPECQR